MESVITTAGLAALDAAILGSTTITVDHFHIGDSAGFTPSTSATDVSGSTVFSGTTTNLYYFRIDDNNFQFIVYMEHDEGVSDFAMGNIMLFLDDNTPFLLAVAPQVHNKLVTDASKVGRRFVIPMAISYTDTSDAFDVSALSEFAVQFDSVANLGAIDQVVFTTSQVNSQEDYTGTQLVSVFHDGNRIWWGNSFFQSLSDPNFGCIDGGTVGTGYGSF